MQLLERRLLLTPEGKEELALEIACLEQVRREIIAESCRASEAGRSALQSELSAVEEQICRLQDALDSGELVSDTGLVVAVGSEVTLAGENGEETVTIGGPLAASPRLGCVSYQSPLARVLLGRMLGEGVEIVSPEGRQQMRVTGIKRGRPGASLG